MIVFPEDVVSDLDKLAFIIACREAVNEERKGVAENDLARQFEEVFLPSHRELSVEKIGILQRLREAAKSVPVDLKTVIPAVSRSQVGRAEI